MAYGYRIFFSERIRNRVVCWDPDAGTATIVAGDGVTGSGDDQRLHDPYGLAIDASGHLLISDKLQHRIVRLTNRLEAVDARNCERVGAHGVHRSRNMERPKCPTGMHTGRDHSLLVSMSDDHSIRRIHPDGRMEVVLGVADGGPVLFGEPPVAIPEALVRSTPVRVPAGLVERQDGSLIYIERGYQLVRHYVPGRGIASLFPHDQARVWRGHRETPARIAMRDYSPVYPTALAEDARGQLFLADAWHRCVWQMDLAQGMLIKVMETPADPARPDGGPAALACGTDGTLWVLDYGDGRISGHLQTPTGWRRSAASCSTIYEAMPCSASEGSGLVCAR
jgi:hypothetical protein